MLRTGRFSISELHNDDTKEKLSRAGCPIGRLRETRIVKDLIHIDLRTAVLQIVEVERWGHEAFELAFASVTIPSHTRIIDHLGPEGKIVECDTVVILPSFDKTINIKMNLATVKWLVFIEEENGAWIAIRFNLQGNEIECHTEDALSSEMVRRAHSRAEKYRTQGANSRFDKAVKV